MNIELNKLTVREVAEGYEDNAEAGVKGYGGRLDIRPAYQREFVYDDAKRDAVIDTIRKGFPLNVMYWVKRPDGTFEVMDGQQRTISFCRYVNGDFSLDHRTFANLTKTEQDRILDYELMVYFCEGNEKDKLDWFRIINIAGERLTDQELLNATYTGPWLADAKVRFSKTRCAAFLLAEKYVIGAPLRQELLEKALDWISGGKIADYMSAHQHDPNANALWTYFHNVIDWAALTFPHYRKEMKGVAWGPLYDRFHDKVLDAKALEKRIAALMMDDDVSRKGGAYPYVLDGDERHLNIRAFSDAQKREAYERQKGVCKKCRKACAIEEMEADHIKPWSRGGKTLPENCQLLCRDCNRRKSDK